MTTEIISVIIGIGAGIIAAIIRLKSGKTPAKKRRKHHYDPSDPVKTLPWFGKGYKKRQERQRRRDSFLDF